MRIQTKKIKYKNILSTGNNFTTIDFDTKPTTLISGTNGSGKSTLLDAIVFGLYGKPFRKVNKGQLINTINNKELLVEIYFQVGGKNYMVKRGMRPVVFEIYQDGQLINQDAAKKDYQEYLETSIIGINYKSFNQIVVLGSATYVPFMELHAGARRDIIEDLLDIQVFSTMGWLAKDQMKETTDDINDNAYQIELNESKIDSARENNEEIRKIKEVEVSKIKERMSVEIDTVESKNDIIDTQDEIIKTLYDDISDKPEEKQKFQDATEKRSDLERQRIAYEKEVAFYHDHDNCPTCKQGIEHDFKQDQINEKNSHYFSH
jgi:DNA repair exonuclease SbcCD ATPase subunit